MTKIGDQVSNFFAGGVAQDDFMHVIDKLAKTIEALSTLLPVIAKGNLANVSQWAHYANPIRRGVWATFALRDASRLIKGDLLEKTGEERRQVKADQRAINTIKTLKVAFEISFTLNSAALLSSYFTGTERFQELASSCGKVMPYFVLGMTSIATTKSVVGKADKSRTINVTNFLDPAGDLVFVVCNSFVKPYVSAGLATKLTLAAAAGSGISSLAKLTNIGYRNWPAKNLGELQDS
ncbi:MAG: hypothetical protein JSR80_01905 [Verrucomicrobia bacterium]|nr:hypothetical protein [Verrucomicrobiota bacterium]